MAVYLENDTIDGYASFFNMSSSIIQPYLVEARLLMPLSWWLSVLFVFVLILLMVVWLFKLERSHRRLLRGPDATHIGHSLEHLTGEVDELTAFRSELELYLSEAEKRLRGSIRGVGTVRFNPFHGQGSGGNQSFATAFISEDGNGVVVSSLYARDHVSMYAKPLKGGKSNFELTDEERQAVAAAKENLKPTLSKIYKEADEELAA